MARKKKLETTVVTSEQPVVKRRPGRPRKIKTPEELEKLNKPKLTLEQRQEIKLQQQKAKEAAKRARGESEPKNKERFYCTNKELQAELIKWRDSNLKVEQERIAKGLPIIYEDRKLSDELGKMLLAISNKLLNHSNFRNYTKELKEDMRGHGIYKVLRGLKSYNFKFNNPFAWITQALYNAYLTIIGKHYKHINTKKELLKKYSIALDSFRGISCNNAISKYIKNYLGEDYGTDGFNINEELQ